MGVLKAKDYPLADKERPWDAAAAEDRIRRWAGGPDKDTIDWKKYSSCFLYVVDGEEENFTGYKLPYCDIINGEPHIIYRAVVAIMAALNGARGGVNVSENERKQIYSEVKKLYAKFDEEAPELKSILLDAEFRAFRFDEFLTDETSEDYYLIEGYAAVFNKPSEDLGGFVERIKPGAFKNSLQNDVRALLNHDPNYVLGRTKSGTLGLLEDENGLYVSIKAPKTSWVEDLIVSMRRGDIDQMSFGFYVVDDEWRVEEGKRVRILKEVDLFDVSIVTFPAYPQTKVQVRAKLDEIERYLNEIDDKLSSLLRGGDEASDLRRVKLLKRKLQLLNKEVF